MIIGLGIDLTDIRRIERVLERYGERFTHRVFTPTERMKSDSRRRRAESYAKRFAAKEACAKALGTGVPRQGVHWRHIGVVNDPAGAPAIELCSAARARLEQMTPASMYAVIHLSISDEYPYAFAKAIIEAIPAGAKI